MIEREDARAAVKIRGDMVASSCAGLKAELRALISAGARELVLDFGEATRIDSVGIGTLLAAHNSLVRAGGRLQVANACADLQKLLRTMRLDQTFRVL